MIKQRRVTNRSIRFLRDVAISTEAYLKTSKYETQERARDYYDFEFDGRGVAAATQLHRGERSPCRLSSQRLAESRLLLVILRCCCEHTRPAGCLACPPPYVRGYIPSRTMQLRLTNPVNGRATQRKHDRDRPSFEPPPPASTTST